MFLGYSHEESRIVRQRNQRPETYACITRLAYFTSWQTASVCTPAPRRVDRIAGNAYAGLGTAAGTAADL